MRRRRRLGVDSRLFVDGEDDICVSCNVLNTAKQIKTWELSYFEI